MRDSFKNNSRNNQSGNHKNNRKKKQIICRCNNVDRETIESAICSGCDTMNKIFDETSAGVGPCGGSCRRKLKPLLDHYLATGTFPETIIEDRTGKVDPKASDPQPSIPTDASEISVLKPTIKPVSDSSDENQ